MPGGFTRPGIFRILDGDEIMHHGNKFCPVATHEAHDAARTVQVVMRQQQIHGFPTGTCGHRRDLAPQHRLLHHTPRRPPDIAAQAMMTLPYLFRLPYKLLGLSKRQDHDTSQRSDRNKGQPLRGVAQQVIRIFEFDPVDPGGNNKPRPRNQAGDVKIDIRRQVHDERSAHPVGQHGIT